MEMKMMQKGSKVKCVWAAGSEGLEKGETYEIDLVSLPFGNWVRVKGFRNPFLAERFEVVS